jgi:hypothetical protein
VAVAGFLLRTVFLVVGEGTLVFDIVEGQPLDLEVASTRDKVRQGRMHHCLTIREDYSPDSLQRDPVA